MSTNEEELAHKDETIALLQRDIHYLDLREKELLKKLPKSPELVTWIAKFDAHMAAMSDEELMVALRKAGCRFEGDEGTSPAAGAQWVQLSRRAPTAADSDDGEDGRVVVRWVDGKNPSDVGMDTQLWCNVAEDAAGDGRMTDVFWLPLADAPHANREGDGEDEHETP
jgi:hypothetical protein